MVHSQEFNALRIHLQNAKAGDINDVLEKILKFRDELNCVVPIVLSKITEGLYILDAHLVDLLTHTVSPELYQKTREQVIKNPWESVNLYKGKYPDPSIEDMLCKLLYEIAANDANYLRRCIVEAMQEVGSASVLPTLEALVFDLMPSAKIRTIFSDALGPIDGIENRSRISFLQSVEIAINQIKRRNSEQLEQNSSDLIGLAPNDKLENSTKLEVPLPKIESEFDAIICVMLIRRNAEALAKNSYRHLGHERNGKPARKMMLEELMKPLRDGGAPEIFIHLLQMLQLFGNFAAHDQGEQSAQLTKEIASALTILYDQAVTVQSVWHSAGGQASSTSSQ
jgi:hypothetical protein